MPDDSNSNSNSAVEPETLYESSTSQQHETQQQDQTSSAVSSRDDLPVRPSTDAEKGNIDNETGKDPNLVEWEPNDPDDPKNWSTLYRCWLTFQLGMIALSASLGSSIIAPADNTIARYVGVSDEVAVLNISLYIVGFALGPSLWAPISEIWGRRISLLPAVFCLGLFSIGTAASQNAQSVFITRFFGGLFGSGPVSNVAAALGDFWDQKARGTAVAMYAVAVVGGPTLGPLIGAAILVNPSMGWRWTCYFLAIFTFFFWTMGVLFLTETYTPVLLKRKAARLRKSTGNSALYHPHEHMKLDPKSIVSKHFTRPILMLTTEPMVTCIAIYASFVFALLYGSLEVFPIVFEEHRHWAPVPGSLPFLALFVGVLAAVGINLGNQKRYIRISRAAHGKPVPEARLPPVAIGGILFTIGLFWFGWTAAPRYHWALPVVAAGFIGAGFNTIFQQCINFLVDTYGLYAASAVSANTLLRSVLAAALPLVARPMFHNLGVGPAMSILGALAACAIPVPFVFMRYGKDLRRRSKFAPYEETEDAKNRS